MKLKAPFPWFGGKSRVAGLVWNRFGDVPNYVEPFAGSLAVMLARPTAPRIETVNDADCYLANFWRAVIGDPEGVAHYADWPVNEADLHARHLWLVKQKDFRERMKTDPDYFDARIAGWWAWGISQWIGAGWCAHPEWRGRGAGGKLAGRGVNRQTPKGKPWRKRPILDGIAGVNAALPQKRPILQRTSVGRGIGGLPRQIPDIAGDSGATGRGIHASAGWKVRPNLSSGNGTHGRRVHLGRSFQLQATARREGLVEWMGALQSRLRTVRVCCGDWSRIMGPSPTTYIGVTAVFLDPPYGEKADRAAGLYRVDCLKVSDAVREWSIAHGHDRKLRIALCGYEGEHAMPADWECVAWKAAGGYANRTGNNRNAGRERIWFSPHCLKPELTLL